MALPSGHVEDSRTERVYYIRVEVTDVLVVKVAMIQRTIDEAQSWICKSGSNQNATYPKRSLMQRKLFQLLPSYLPRELQQHL